MLSPYFLVAVVDVVTASIREDVLSELLYTGDFMSGTIEVLRNKHRKTKEGF